MIGSSRFITVKLLVLNRVWFTKADWETFIDVNLHSTPSMSGLAKVGNLLSSRAAFPLARRTESFW